MARQWVLISVAVSAGASVVDYAIVLALTHGTPLPIPLAIAGGLLVGASVSFFGNRRLAFGRRSAVRVSVEALRFFTALAVLMVIHGFAAAALRRQGLSVVPSKMTADFFVMGINQPWVFKRFVFRTSPSAVQPRLDSQPQPPPPLVA